VVSSYAERSSEEALNRTSHTNFYEKALFVKPTWRPSSVTNATSALP
jgi:hypothetical protein